MRQAWQTAIVAGVLLIGASAGDPGTGYVYVANVTYGSRGQSFHPWPPLPSNVTSVHDFSYTVLLWVDPAAVSSTAPASSSVLQVGTGLGVTLQNTRSVCVYTTAANATADQIQTASWMFLGITVYGGPRRNITLNLIGSDGTVVERAARLPSDLSVPNSTVWLTGPSPSPPPFFGVVADLRLWAHALSVSDLMKVRASVMPLATTTPQPGVTGGTAYQGYALNLTCDRGLRIASIRFASFGTPSGLFPAFAMGPYHAANSSAIVRNRCAGLPSCSVPVATSLFGDPASGQQPMRLSVVAQCSITTTRAVVKRAVTVRHTSGTRPGLPSKPLTSAPVNSTGVAAMDVVDEITGNPAVLALMILGVIAVIAIVGTVAYAVRGVTMRRRSVEPKIVAERVVPYFPPKQPAVKAQSLPVAASYWLDDEQARGDRKPRSKSHQGRNRPKPSINPRYANRDPRASHQRGSQPPERRSRSPGRPSQPRGQMSIGARQPSRKIPRQPPIEEHFF
ncbi:SUEL-type lectin domain-containing protein [Plasmodiophora brassicae]